MNRALKIVTTIIGVILVLCILLFVAFKVYPEKIPSLFMPEVSNVRMDATQSENGKMNMNIHAEIDKSVIPFFLDSIKYKAVLYQETISTGIKDFTNDTGTNLTLPVTVDYKKLVKLMKSHEGDSTIVKFITSSYLHLPIIGEQKVNFNKDLKFKMLIFPEVSIDKIKVDKFGMNNMKLNVRLKVTNPNDVAINLSHMKYDMAIDEYLQTKGESKERFHLKAQGSDILALEMKSDVDKPLKAIVEALKGKKKWPYKLNSTMVVEPDIADMEKINFKMALNGELDPGDLKK